MSLVIAWLYKWVLCLLHCPFQILYPLWKYRVEEDAVKEEASFPHLLAEAPICMQKTEKFMGYKSMWFGARLNSAL